MTLVVVTKTTISVCGLYVLLTVDGDPELSLAVVMSRNAPLVHSLATVVYSIRDIVVSVVEINIKPMLTRSFLCL